MSAIYFDARIDSEQLDKDVAHVNKKVSEISQNVEKEGREIDAISGRMGAGLIAAFSFAGLGAFITNVAKVRGEYQQLEVAFETMLGSKAKADQLMSEVVDFASKTPFELSQVASGTKMLLAYGTASEDIIPTLKSLGDVSAGLSIPIERLILNYGQVRTQMKMTGRELKDFQVMGVPLVAELSKQIGVSEQKIQDMVSAGEIGFDKVEQAFKSMTEEGGKFNNLMDKQSATITGLASNFADAWDKMLNAIGQQNEGIISGVIKGSITIVENYEEVIKILKILIVTYGAYKAAVIATTIAQSSSAIAANVKAWIDLARGIRTAKDAQIAFNLATKANPYGLALAAVAALVTALSIYSKKTDESAKVTADFTKNLNEEKKAIKEAFDAVKSAKDGTDQRAKAIALVNEKYKQYLPNLLTEADNLYAVEKAQNAVTTAIAKTLAFKAQEDSLQDVNSNVEKQLENFYKQINDASKKLNDAQKGQFTALIEGYKESLRQQFDELGYFPEFSVNRINDIFKKVSGENLGGFALSDLNDAFKSLIRSEVELEDKTQGLKTTYDEYLKVVGIGSSSPEPVVLTTINEKIQETKTLLDQAKTKLNELRSGSSTASTSDITDQQKKIKEYEAELETLTGISVKVRKELDKSAQERLQAEREYASEQLNIDRSLEASRIALMKEGEARQLKEAELAHANRLDQIRQQELELIEAYNATLGFKSGDKGYKTELPQDDPNAKKFTEMRTNEEQAFNDKKIQINADAAKAIKAIWDEVNEVYVTGNDRQIADINKKYDNLVDAARKGGATLQQVAFINNARMKEITDANADYELDIAYRKIELEQQIASAKLSIQADGFASEMLMMRENFNSYKKYQLEKIKILQQSDKKEDREQAKVLSTELDAAELNYQLDILQQIGEQVYQIMSGITNELEKQGYLTQEQAQYMNGWAEAISKGKGLQKIISEGMEMLIRSFPESASAKYAEQMERINQALREQDRLINQSKRTGEEKDALFQKYQVLLKQNKVLNEQLDQAQKDLDNTWMGKLSPFWNSRVKAVNNLTAAVRESDNALKDAEQAFNDFVSGGVTQNTIADTIAKAFESGKTSVDDFADYMNDVLLDAVMNIFKAEILGPQIDDLAKYTLKALSDNVLTDAEKKEIDRRTKEIADANKGLWDNLTSALNLPGAEKEGPKGLTGAIKGITEETAGLIAGQFYAFRESQQSLLYLMQDQAPVWTQSFTKVSELVDIQNKSWMTGLEQLDGINQSVTHLAEIAINTRHNARLNEIADGVTETNKILRETLT